MDKIIAYKIVSSLEGFQGLMNVVNEEIQNGWQPIGGVCTTKIALPFDPNDESIAWFQAIVEYA